MLISDPAAGPLHAGTPCRLQSACVHACMLSPLLLLPGGAEAGLDADVEAACSSSGHKHAWSIGYWAQASDVVQSAEGHNGQSGLCKAAARLLTIASPRAAHILWHSPLTQAKPLTAFGGGGEEAHCCLAKFCMLQA